MPNENIETVTQIERKVGAPGETGNYRIDAVLSAIMQAVKDVSHKANFGKLDRHRRVSIPHRATAVRIGLEASRAGIKSIISDMCGQTRLHALDVGNRALFQVVHAPRRTVDLYPGMPFNIWLQRIEELPHDEEEKRDAMKALKLLQFHTGYRQHGATHVVWTGMDDDTVEPNLFDADRVAPLNIISVPQARRHSRSLAQIVARTIHVSNAREKEDRVVERTRGRGDDEAQLRGLAMLDYYPSGYRTGT